MGMDALSVWTGLAPRGAFGHRPPRKQLSRVPQWRASIRQRILPQSTSSEAWDSSHASEDSDGETEGLPFLSRLMAAFPRHPAKAALAGHLLPDEQADEADAHDRPGKPVAVLNEQVDHSPFSSLPSARARISSAIHSVTLISPARMRCSSSGPARRASSSVGALGGNEAGTKNLEPSPVRIHVGFTPSWAKMVNSYAAGIIMRRLASESEMEL